MYTKILVPMDGSEIAECVLPILEWFVRVSNVKEIVIIRVVEPMHMRDDIEKHIPPDERKHIEEDSRELAEAYCKKIISRLKNNEVTKTATVLTGKPARAITEYVTKDKEIDLIIMATHGRSGVGRLLHGSTADQIIHDAVVPIMLVTPHDRKPDR